jgi:hypothetical protein
MTPTAHDQITLHRITGIMILVCQGAWGLGGQDWDGPHWCGQALIRSHRPLRTGWVGSTGHYEDSIG